VWQTRSVSDPVQPFPQATFPVLQRLHRLPDLPHLDQLTVNEYCPGVGLAPHIDTHSAFTGEAASLTNSPHPNDYSRLRCSDLTAPHKCLTRVPTVY